jgi:hypothetical protein
MINTANQTKTDVNSLFSQEVQSNVAKLLSKENISIHRSFKYKTASFDIQNRELRMPIFKDVPRDVYDLFIGHEIGHALWTKMDDFKSFIVKFKNKHLLNVLEDIRIEKLSQATYPGLIQCFKKGYTYLYENKFFGDNTQEYIDGLNLLDKINIVAKLGKNRVNPQFTTEEAIILEEALKIKTHKDIERVAELILAHISKTKEKEPKPSPNDSSSNDGDTGDSSDEDNSKKVRSDDNIHDDGEESFSNDDNDDIDSNNDDKLDENFDDNHLESEDKQDSTKDNNPSNGSQSVVSDDNIEDNYPEIISETEQELEKNLDKLRIDEEDAANAKNSDFQFKAPRKDQIENCIITYKKLFAFRDQCGRYRNVSTSAKSNPNIELEYQSFLKSNKKMVSILRSEFEQKKSAYEYTRAKVSKRGTINVNALHQYKYSEDIFSSVTELAQAKSHGIVFLLDYSGSMCDVLQPIIQKVLVLTDFCKSLSIPFEVYAFTSSSSYDYIESKNGLDEDQIILSDTKIMQMLSSDMTKAEYHRAHRDLFLQSLHTATPISSIETLGGTPLLESLVISHYLIKMFKEKHSIQIVNLMVLSDGEGSQLVFNRQLNPAGERITPLAEGKAYGKLFGGKWFNFRVYSRAYSVNSIKAYFMNMEALLKNMKDSMNINTICYYVASTNSKVKNKAHDISTTLYEEYVNQEKLRTYIQESIKKTSICQIENVFGYDKYILMFNARKNRSYRAKDRNKVEEEEYDSFDEVEFNENTTDKDIERMFVKFNKGNRAIKIFAKEFIETISKNF